MRPVVSGMRLLVTAANRQSKKKMTSTMTEFLFRRVEVSVPESLEFPSAVKSVLIKIY
jgi:hypothetical protein